MTTATVTASAESNLGDLPEWQLDDLFPGPQSAEYAQAVEQAGAMADAFVETWQGNLAEAAGDGARLARAVRDYEALSDHVGRIASFAFLYYAGNTTDPARAKFFGDAQQMLSAISTRLVFFTLELNRIDDAVIEQALDHDELKRYRTWFEDQRKGKPYQLEDRLEQLFVEKSLTGSSAWSRLFDETMASLTFDVDGEELQLEPVLSQLTSPDGAKRKSAAMALSKVLGDNIRLFTLITNVLAKDKEISDRWRGFEDVAASRHLANSVEKPVVDALEASVRAAYPRLSHRYYAMKAKWFGVETLDFWDRNAPLPNEDTRLVSWDEAQKIVLDAYGGFAPEMADIARRFFDDRWIDAATRPGKRSGAFSHSTVPSAHPYVLLNYQGKPRDVMTLAHELGHGVHQVLAAEQGPLLASTPLTLAETASVFGEMLTFQSLLSRETDPAKRKILLAGKVEDMLNTVVRQIAFYTFERKVHIARRDSELTAEQLGDIWLEVQRESLGAAIDLGEGYEHFWAYIPHFIHSPFYVYAYAFGDCLVNSLYARYREADEGFQTRYFDLLKAGGSKHHSDLLKPFGLDASDPDFWNMGLAMIESMIEEIAVLDGARA